MRTWASTPAARYDVTTPPRIAAEAAEPILETRDLVAGYGEADILHGVSIRVPDRSFVSVIGPNGAGKSTLLKAIYGIVALRGGSVTFRGNGSPRDISGRPPHQLTDLGLNYVPQVENIFPNLSIQENLEIGSFRRRSDHERNLERVLAWFPMLGQRLKARAGVLSGGQRHMLALARALMSEPVLLLLDEPSAGLSPAAVDDVFERIEEINRAGVSIVMVEQNARRSLGMSTFGYVLDMGRNRYEGPGEQLLHDENVVELYLGGRSRLAAPTDRDADPTTPGSPPAGP
jgi:ABC-type branched-subunit amino acid transport system ATPase component